MIDLITKISSPAMRISFALVLFTLSILLVADSIFKFSEDSTKSLVEMRKVLCETLVYQASFLIQNGKEETLTQLISVTVENNPDVLSMALRDQSGSVSIITDNHDDSWVELAKDQSTLTQAQLPVFDGDYRWGTLQVRFKPGTLSGTLHLLQHPFIKLTLFVSLVGFLVYLWFIKKTLQYLDPSALIPERVKTALDSLAEGVILLDKKGHIALANSTFENVMQKPVSQLIGKKASEFNWDCPSGESQYYQLPWVDTINEGITKSGFYLVLIRNNGINVSFNVNSSPIYGGKGEIRGAIVSFADITELEQTNKKLITSMEELDVAHKKLLQQNKELERLATRDPLTGCLNRRAFFEILNNEINAASKNNTELCCIMCDIDHFKKINDSYGHGIGDMAIQSVAKILTANLRTNDVICRYGGEEFVILLVGMGSKQAYEVAERMRLTVKFNAGLSIRDITGIEITSSFGLTSLKFGATDPEKFVGQADDALYVSKKSGRNLVSCFDIANLAVNSI